MNVSACLVTRGDVDMTEILASIEAAGITDVCIWNNSLEIDLAVFGRYAVMDQAVNDIIYVQDDDCVVNIPRLLGMAKLWPLNQKIVANMPESRWPDYPDSCLVGWGAIFHRDLVYDAWRRFTAYRAIGRDAAAFNRECDAVFTTLTPHVKIDVGFSHLPWAEDPGRAMYLSPRPDRETMYALAREARDA